jgi:hypothetical protein
VFSGLVMGRKKRFSKLVYSHEVTLLVLWNCWFNHLILGSTELKSFADVAATVLRGEGRARSLTFGDQDTSIHPPRRRFVFVVGVILRGVNKKF